VAGRAGRVDRGGAKGDDGRAGRENKTREGETEMERRGRGGR